MHGKHDISLRKNVLAKAISVSLGMVTLGLPGLAVSDIYVWGALTGPASDTSVCSTSTEAVDITFTMLDPKGTALANSSITTKGANQFQTPTCGTLTYNTASGPGGVGSGIGGGTLEIAAFQFFGGDPTLPATAKNITLAKVPSGLDDGSGNLILANMLFDYNGTFGIPVSISYDARTLLDEMDGTPNSFTVNSDGTFTVISALVGDGSNGAVTGAAPASDGTWTNATFGYLGLGPVPLATTEFDTTNVAACALGACLTVNPSADITANSAVPDLTPNANEFDQGDGFGIGGYPMQDGPFTGFNANFDFTSMTLTSFTDETKPVLTLNGASVVTVILNDPYDELGATCVDALPVGGSITVGAPTGGPVSTSIEADTILTYTCTDTAPAPNANVSQVTRTVRVVDSNALIELNANANLEIDPVTQECGVPYVGAGATCTDDPEGNIPISGTGLDPFTFNVDLTGVDVFTTDVPSTAVWYCTDSVPNTKSLPRTVNVVDTTLPVITIIAATEGGTDIVNLVSSTLENPSTYIDQGATAADSCDPSVVPTATGNVFSTVVPDTGLDTIVKTVTYTAIDNDVNTATKFRTVNIDRSQPVITLLDKDGLETTSGNIVVISGSVYTEFGMNIHDVQEGDVAAATLASGTGGTAGALSYTISGSVDTATPGDYIITYTAVDSTGAGNKATPVERIVTVADANTTGIGNFTMLDASGGTIGGTNDITYIWDGSFTSSVVDPASVDAEGFGVPTDTTAVMTYSTPTSFNGFNWKAKNVRIFEGPAKLKFDVTCLGADYAAGTVVCNRLLSEQSASKQFVKIELAAGEIGAHVLFDWGSVNGSTPCGVANCDIDVVNAWTRNGVWADSDGDGPTNNLFLEGPFLLEDADGKLSPPAVDTTWFLVSTDVNGENGKDGINGERFIDGAFIGFRANFNFGPGDAGVAVDRPVTKISDVSVSALGLWSLIGSLLTVFGLRKFNNKK